MHNNRIIQDQQGPQSAYGGSISKILAIKYLSSFVYSDIITSGVNAHKLQDGNGRCVAFNNSPQEKSTMPIAIQVAPSREKKIDVDVAPAKWQSYIAQ